MIKKIKNRNFKYKVNIIYNRKYLFKFIFNSAKIKIEKWLFS